MTGKRRNVPGTGVHVSDNDGESEGLNWNDGPLPDEASTEERIVAFTKSHHARTNLIPSLREITVGLKLTTRAVYKAFPKGLRAICAAAGLAAPVDRLEAVAEALSKRGQHPEKIDNPASTSKPQHLETERSILEDPDLHHLQQDLNDIGRRTTLKTRKLELIKQITLQTEKEKRLDGDIAHEERQQHAKRMLENETEYVNGLRLCLRESTQIESELRHLFTELGHATDFDAWTDTLIRQNYTTTSKVATIFPKLLAKNGRQPMDFPILDDFPTTEWEAIIGGLRDEAACERFCRHLEHLEEFRPDMKCRYDQTVLRNMTGSIVFLCSFNHVTIFRCPDCGSPLTLLGGKFTCSQCWKCFLAISNPIPAA